MKTLVFFCLVVSLAFSDAKLIDLYLSSKATQYRPVTHREYNDAVQLFEMLFKNPLSCLDSKLDSLHLKRIEISPDMFCIIDTRKEGRGFYMIRKDKNTKSLISIPHRFYDLKTAEIAYKMISENPYKAAAFNTVHRKTMDAAHTEYTLFNAFHLAFSKVYPQEYIYQLHGFSNKKRSTLSAQKAEAIVSNATKYITKMSENICSCLNAENIACALYGKNIFELGGTKNQQYKTLSAQEYENFIHIELNPKVRKTISKDIEVRNKAAGCLP